MYKLVHSIALLIILTLVSCSSNATDRFKDKEAYLKGIESLSDSKRKQQLLKDADFIEKTLDDVKDISMYFGFSMSMSSGSSSSSDVDEAKPFILNSKETYLNDFSKLNDSIIVVNQDLIEGLSNFDFYALKEEFQAIDRSDLIYTVKNIYENGSKKEKATNTLLPVDSIDVNVKLVFPTAYDSIVIPLHADSVIYKNEIIYIDSRTDNSIELKSPASVNILDYRATSINGVFMDKSNYSSYPITGFSPIILKQIQESVDLLRKAAQAEDKQQSLAYINEIPSVNFENIALTIELGKDFKLVEKKKTDGYKEVVNAINKLTEKYGRLLAITNQSIELGFPTAYDNIYLYVRSQNHECDTTLTVTVNKDDDYPYTTFSDSTKTKYGIVDHKGQIVIPATYPYLIRQDTLFYKVMDENEDINYYLNETTKKLEKLPSNLSFVEKLNNDLIVFSNKDGYEGVLENLKDEIIPFKYDDYYLYGKTIIARFTKRGRDYYDLYSIDGKQLDLPQLKNYVVDPSSSGIIIVTQDNKYGFINKEGEITISPNYRHLKFAFGDLLAYKDGRTNGSSSDPVYLLGLMDKNSKVVQKSMFYDISDINDNRVLFSVFGGSLPNSSLLFGYMDGNGNIVIKPQYNNAFDFYKGYALVLINNQYFLVDTNGQIVKSFSEGLYVSKRIADDDSYYYQVYDTEQKYNYRGDKIQ